MARMGQRIDLSILNETDAAKELGVEFDSDEYIVAGNFRMVPAVLWDELVAAYDVDENKWTKEAADRLRVVRAKRAAILIREWNLVDPFNGLKFDQPYHNEELFLNMAPPLLGLLEQAITLHYKSKEAKMAEVGEG